MAWVFLVKWDNDVLSIDHSFYFVARSEVICSASTYQQLLQRCLTLIQDRSSVVCAFSSKFSPSKVLSDE